MHWVQCACASAWNNSSEQGVNCPIHLNGVWTSKPPAENLDINIFNYFIADISAEASSLFLSYAKLLSCTFSGAKNLSCTTSSSCQNLQLPADSGNEDISIHSSSIVKT